MVRFKGNLFLVLLLWVITYISVYGQDCSNLQGIEIISPGATDLCGAGSLEFFLTYDLLDGPLGEDYSFYITSSGSGTCIANPLWSFGSDTQDPQLVAVTFFPAPGCEPIIKDIFVDVICDSTGDTVVTDVFVNTVTLYPSLNIDFTQPGCGPGETGSIVITNDYGEVCSETVLGTPGVEGICNGIDGFIQFDSTYFAGTPCEQSFDIDFTTSCNTGITGCTDPDACNYNPDASCDDGNCIVQDICCPDPVFSSFPNFLCSGNNEVCIEFTDDVEISIDDIVILDESISNFDENQFVTSAQGNTICISIDTINLTCEPLNIEMAFIYSCRDQAAFIIDIGTVVLYPDADSFIPTFSDYSYEECTPPPVQTGSSTCPTNVVTEFQPPDNDCTPEDGLFIWEASPDFFTGGNISVCFQDLRDTIYIAPCPSIPSNGTLFIKKNE